MFSIIQLQLWSWTGPSSRIGRLVGPARRKARACNSPAAETGSVFSVLDHYIPRNCYTQSLKLPPRLRHLVKAHVEAGADPPGACDVRHADCRVAADVAPGTLQGQTEAHLERLESAELARQHRRAGGRRFRTSSLRASGPARHPSLPAAASPAQPSSRESLLTGTLSDGTGG